MRHLALLLAALAAPLAALDVGDPAPPLAAVEWVKGEATEPGGGRVTVVEFWATWCPPCRESIPHLSALQAKHGEQVAIIGLSDEDRATVEPFVAKMGAKMDYRVGLADEATNKAYMEGVRGIPHAFLVGADGTVLWKGHPSGLDQPLADVLAGTWDPERSGRVAKLETDLQAIFSGRGEPDFERAIELSGELLALDPGHELGLRVRLGVARHLERPAVHEETLAALPIDALPAQRLNSIAWDLLTAEDLAWRAPAHALRLARAAKDMEPRNAAIADTWARALYTLGLVDEAIAAQREALGLAEAGDRAAYEATLAYYESVKALQADARGAAPAAPAPAAAPAEQPVP